MLLLADRKDHLSACPCISFLVLLKEEMNCWNHRKNSRSRCMDTERQRQRDTAATAAVGFEMNSFVVPVKPCKIACLEPLPVTVTHKSIHVSLAEKSWGLGTPMLVLSALAFHKDSLSGDKPPTGGLPAAYNAAAAPPLPPAWCTPFGAAIVLAR